MAGLFYPKFMKKSPTMLGSTNLNWENILLWTIFSQILSVKSYTPNYCSAILLPSITRYFKQFSRVEHYTVLMNCSPIILIPSFAQLFEQLGMDGTTLNSWNILDLWSLFSPLFGSSSGSTGFPTPKSWNLLLWSLLFPLLSSSRTSAVLNFLELKKNSSFNLIPFITLEFKQFSFF